MVLRMLARWSTVAQGPLDLLDQLLAQDDLMIQGAGFEGSGIRISGL